MTKNSWPERLMKATGKLRMVFGPADQGALGGPVQYVDDAAHRERQKQLQQWDVVRNSDGSTYLVSRVSDGRA
ncbi:hypothetical protein BJ994_003390 [Arthrobacter pigmenti]|uniref:Uncharacterized protein n=1 Tax=Arthrobacter pigmenti TaxID=271432 RepID=A0A846RUR7_9MICC|nr:hypothetical protein [Arthrobacter pigmenti]NJC24314.1 hypothetical protein [Arthrobacter pigmenti]